MCKIILAFLATEIQFFLLIFAIKCFVLTVLGRPEGDLAIELYELAFQEQLNLSQYKI